MKRSSFSLLVLAGLSLLAGARAQSPLPLSPAVPTVYSSAQFHAGGVSTPYPYLVPTTSNPLIGQLQGTPTGVVNALTAPMATEIPSFLLGNYDPTIPPGVTVPNNYFPNHFRDGSFTSWSAPFTFLSTLAATTLTSPIQLGTYNAALLAANPVAAVLNHDVQSTPTAVNWSEYPEITNAKYYGIAPAATAVTAPPDTVPYTGIPVATAGYTTATDGAHAIRQLVYFGRSEYVYDTQATSPTVNKLIHVGAIYCVNGFTGEIVWRYQTARLAFARPLAPASYTDPSSTVGDPAVPVFEDDSVLSAPAVARINVRTSATTIANKLVVIVGDNNGFVYCLDAVGSGTVPGSTFGSSNSDAVDATNNQPVYDPTAAAAADTQPGHLGTTAAYWVYRPDATHPLDKFGVPITTVVAGSNLPVPGAFGVASPNVYVENRIATASPTQSNSIIYMGNTRGVLYALDGLGVPNVRPSTIYNDSLPNAASAGTGVTPFLPNEINSIATATPTTNVLWWFYPGGDSNPSVSMEATPAVAPPLGPFKTYTVVTASADPAQIMAGGAPETFTATVTDGSANGGSPTGTVTFTINNGGTLATTTATLVPGIGSSTATVTGTAPATAGQQYTVNASYGGDPNFSVSDNTLSPFIGQVITGVAGTTVSVVTSSLNPAFARIGGTAGDTVMLTGSTYDGMTGNLITTAIPTLTVDGAPVVPANANPYTVSADTLLTGPHKVVATYNGAFGNSASPNFYQIVIGPTGPTVFIGSSFEMGAGSNAGYLYAVDGYGGPNGSQRPLWAFPNRYAAVPRPALGNISGSPVVFSNPDDLVSPGGPPRTRVYFAANVGAETPFTATGNTPATAPAPRPATDQTGRIWAVNLDGSTAKTTNVSPVVTNVWSYPLAVDPNDPTKDNTPEPSPPIGAFQHATPAMGIVQFPTTISDGTGPAYTHADSVNADVKSKSVPMLYIGTQGVNDFGFYALDVDGYDDATRDIYRIESPTGSAFASSAALVTNASFALPAQTPPTPQGKGTGNGGAVFVTAGNSLFQVSATPITNLNATEAFPFISVDKTFTGFGPVSSPAVGAADVSDLTVGVTLPTYDGGKNVTDWVYIGDSVTGFCRGITPFDANDLAIAPPADYGGVVDSVPPLAIDARYPLRTFLFDGTAAHPKSSLDMTKANPVGAATTVAPFEWGQFAYIRIANVVPPGFVSTAAVPDTSLLVADPNDPTIFYGNGQNITFRVGDTTKLGTYAPVSTINPVVLPAGNLTGAAGENGVTQRSDSTGTASEPTLSSLNDAATGKEWIGVYSYPVGSYRSRSGDTPGARRHITEARQTATAYKLTGASTYTATGTVTLEAQTLQGTQSGSAATGLTQTSPSPQPTFAILNPLALRAGGVANVYSGAPSAAVPVGVKDGNGDGIGPFRAVLPTLPASSADLQALTNNNMIYTTKAPPSGYDVNQDPTQAGVNNQNQANTYPLGYRLVAASLGLLHDNTTGDNSDPNGGAAPPTGNLANGGSGLAVINFGPNTVNVADRSAIGPNAAVTDPNSPTQLLFPPFTIAMQRAGAHWNDNTPSTSTLAGGLGAVINYLPWEDVPSSFGYNNSRDYPDIPPSAISHTLKTALGPTEITGRYGSGVSPDPAGPDQTAGDDSTRNVTLDPVDISMAVPAYQPANLQAWDAINQAGILPGGIVATDITFPQGYVEGAGSTQRVFVDLNHNGVWDNNEPARELQVYSGVAVNMNTSIATPTADVGPVPSGVGVQTSPYISLGLFSPYNSIFGRFYVPLEIHNNGNVNLLNVHMDQKYAIGASPYVVSQTLFSDSVDPLSVIPAFDYSGINGTANAFDVRSSLDTDLAAFARNPGINSAQYPFETFHKPRVGSGAPTIMTVPDVPPPDRNLPGLTGYVASPAPPQLSVAVPFGTPVGSYQQTMRVFEGMDLITGYPSAINGSRYSPYYPPQYGGVIGGQGAPSYGPYEDAYFPTGLVAPGIGSPISDPGVVLKASVTEDRMTDGFTFGALPQIDFGPAGSGGLSTPDFAPAAFQASNGNLSVYWTSNRTGAYGIAAANVGFTSPAYIAAGTGSQSWFAPFTPSLLAGTNSGLTVATDVPLLSGSAFGYDTSTAYAFAVNVNTGPYQNALLCYPVTPGSGALGTGQLVTNDPAQVKYGVRGLYCSRAGFPGNRQLWAFWTASVRGRTSIEYNSREPGTGPWITTPALLPVPAGLTAVSDPCPALSSGVAPSGNYTQAIDVTFSGTGADGNADLYVCRYAPDATTSSQLDLKTFPNVTEILKPVSGWFQARDVGWSRAGVLNVFVGGTPVLYSGTTPQFKTAVFDQASGLLVFTGVSLTGGAGGTNTLYVDIATGRVRFLTPPTTVVTATFSPQARRITEDARADTGVVSFLDPTYKNNEAPGVPSAMQRVQTDRRWYFWRKAGTTGVTGSATLYQKSQRLTLFLPRAVDVTQPITFTGYSGPVDVFNIAAVLNSNGTVKYPTSGRLYFPIVSSGANVEGTSVTVSYTDTDGNKHDGTTFPAVTDTVQWQDEARSNAPGEVPPTDTPTGLATVVDTLVPITTSPNENNVAAFLDVNAYSNPNTVTSSPDAPRKVWLFWNSTRNGTADLYYETFNPRFSTTGP